MESALETPFQSFRGEELYPSVQAKAARSCYGLVKNHSMTDGNRRIGAHTMLVFLALNGRELKYTQKELSDIILEIAAGRKEYDDLLQWIIEHEKYFLFRNKGRENCKQHNFPDADTSGCPRYNVALHGWKVFIL